MVLLYQDPRRKTSTVTTTQKDNPLSMVPESGNEIELKKKMALLEKAIQDRDATITELRSKLAKSDLESAAKNKEDSQN